MTNPTPPGQVPEALRLAELLLNLQTHMGPRRPSHPDDAHRWDGYTQASAELRRLHAEKEAIRATHVQNPAEIEHVAGDVSKNGAELNVSTQQQECGNTPYDEGPFALAQPAAQQGAAYAALPTHSHAGRVYEEGFLISTCKLYTADEMRAFTDATHTLRASHGQAPAHVLHLVQDAFAEVAMAYPKAFALHKVGLADTAVRKALATPTPRAAQQAPAGSTSTTAEQRRLIGVIADKIEDGTLFRSGIYSNKDLARFVRNVADAAAPQPSPTPQAPFQQRVQPWLLECFGAEIAADRMERNHRFLEESLELVQSLGCTANETHQLVDYVFGRPVGDPPQEVGGVMVTLAALCLASGLDMHDAGEVELVRISVPEIVAKIRAKQAAKPKHSPLPQSPPPQADSQPAPVEVADAMADSQYLAGVSAGWNAANADDPNAALQKLHESRAGYLKPLRAGRAPADSVLEDAARRTTKQEHAIRQGHEIAASDGYFEARPQIDSNDRRKVFQAGFERGWDAARKQGANHDN